MGGGGISEDPALDRLMPQRRHREPGTSHETGEIPFIPTITRGTPLMLQGSAELFRID